MADVKHQVFISSTFEDLQDERREVMMALLELDAIPAGMELFQASNDEQFRYISGVIDECDYYILIVAGRYGSTNAAGTSYTELEFDYALKQGKPILAFVHADISTLPVNKAEKTDIGRQRLEAFRDRVTSDRMCKFYHSAQELGGQVSRALTQARKRHPTPGWVRASEAGTVEQTAQIAVLQLRIRELEDALKAQTAIIPSGLIDLETTFDLLLVVPFSFKASSPGFRRLTMYDELPTTRRELFYVLAVRMFAAKNEKEMKTFLDKYIEERTARTLAHSEGLLNAEVTTFAIAGGMFHTLKTYLFGAGLIEPDDLEEGSWILSQAGARMAVAASTSKAVAFEFVPRAAWGKDDAAQPDAETDGDDDGSENEGDCEGEGEGEGDPPKPEDAPR